MPTTKSKHLTEIPLDTETSSVRTAGLVMLVA